MAGSQPQKRRHRQDCCLLSGRSGRLGDILSEPVYSKVSLSSAGDNPEARAALDHRDNEREFNHGSVNLSLLAVTQTRCPETLQAICMFTVVEPRLSESKPGSSLRLMSGSGTHTHTHTDTHTLRHTSAANKRQKKKKLDQD